MIAFPNAKINIGLNIVSKRKDGYHTIDSCFYPIPWYDCLEVVTATSFSFLSYGLEILGNTSSNLCVKAYELIKKNYSIPPVTIRLLKNIPMGAGLGGGSADGAFTLKILNNLFQLHLSEIQLQDYALKLGSDCPFFIKNQPAIATGRGELLEPASLDLSGYFLALTTTEIPIYTKEAYIGIIPKKPLKSTLDTIQTPIEKWIKILKNDFEDSIFPKHPKIELLKKKMYKAKAVYASMTGSGSTVYGIFEKKPPLLDCKIISL